jgi:hypothetical protein
MVTNPTSLATNWRDSELLHRAAGANIPPLMIEVVMQSLARKLTSWTIQHTGRARADGQRGFGLEVPHQNFSSLATPNIAWNRSQ